MFPFDSSGKIRKLFVGSKEITWEKRIKHPRENECFYFYLSFLWDNRNRNRNCNFLFVAEQEEAVEENPELITDTGESYQTPDQLGDLLVTLSLLPESRWKSLTCIDLIKVRLYIWFINNRWQKKIYYYKIFDK